MRVLVILALMGIAMAGPLTPAIAQTDSPLCLLSSTTSVPILDQPSSDGVRVGTVSSQRVYPVLERVIVEGPTAATWIAIEVSPTQRGWVLDDGVTLGGDGCTAIETTVLVIDPTATPTNTPIATPAATTTPPLVAATPSDTSDCPAGFVGYLPPRLSIGMDDATTAERVFAVLRDTPAINGTISGRVNPATTITIEEGPICTNGIVWWRVATDDLTGWTAESNVATGDYFIVPPASPTLIGPAAPALTADNVGEVVLQNQITIETTPAEYAIGASSVTIGTADGIQHLAYPDGELDEELSTFLTDALGDATPTAIAYDTYGSFVLIGAADGTLLLSVADQAVLMLLDSNHETAISTLAFSPDNSQLLAISSDRVTLYDLTSYDAVNATLDTIVDSPAPDDTVFSTGVITTDGTPIIITDDGISTLDVESGAIISSDLTVQEPRNIQIIAAPPSVAGNAVWMLDAGALVQVDVMDDSISVSRLELGSNISSFAVNNAGTLLATTDGFAVQFYALPSFEQVATISNPDTLAVAFTADGRGVVMLTTATLQFWAVN